MSDGTPSVIILCGGTGTRLREETEFKPKAMVQIGDRPILWHIMKHYAHYGFHDFVLGLGYKGHMIEEYFRNGNADGFRVRAVETGPDTMTGGRVTRAVSHTQPGTFMVTYGDAVADVDLGKLLAFHRAHGKLGTVTAVHPRSPFGELDIDDRNHATSWREKPLKSDVWVNGGYFVFELAFLEYLTRGPGADDVVLEREPLERLVRDRQLAVFRHEGFWSCMDTFKDVEFLNALWGHSEPALESVVRFAVEPVLTIVMCTFNEVERIAQAFDDVLGSLHGRSDVEIILLDNGSTDGTREWLAAFRHPAVRIELNPQNLGKGGSVKKGIRMSRGRHVVIHDPDMEYRAADIWRVLDEAEQSGAALVLGSRFLGVGRAQGQLLANYLGVVALSKLINVLYGCRTTDAATAMKMMDGTVARALRLECSGFELDFEIVVRIARLGGAIREVPIGHFPRTVAEGKKVRALRDGLRALRPILLDRFRPIARFRSA